MSVGTKEVLGLNPGARQSLEVGAWGRNSKVDTESLGALTSVEDRGEFPEAAKAGTVCYLWSQEKVLFQEEGVDITVKGSL